MVNSRRFYLLNIYIISVTLTIISLLTIIPAPKVVAQSVSELSNYVCQGLDPGLRNQCITNINNNGPTSSQVSSYCSFYASSGGSYSDSRNSSCLIVFGQTPEVIRCTSSGGTADGSECICPAGNDLIFDSATDRCVSVGAGGGNGGVGICEVNGSILGITTWYRGLNFDADCNPIIDRADFDSTRDDVNPILIIALNITDMILRLAGIIAVIFVIVGGFKYVLSDGAPDKAAEGRKTLVNALVGAVIAGAAATIVTIIVSTLGA